MLVLAKQLKLVMIKPSKTIIAGAAVAGLLTGSFAVRSYASAFGVGKAPPSRCKTRNKKVNTHVRDKIHVRVRADAKPVTTAAKVKTPARARAVVPPTAANRSHSNSDCGIVDDAWELPVGSQ